MKKKRSMVQISLEPYSEDASGKKGYCTSEFQFSAFLVRCLQKTNISSFSIAIFNTNTEAERTRTHANLHYISEFPNGQLSNGIVCRQFGSLNSNPLWDNLGSQWSDYDCLRNLKNDSQNVKKKTPIVERNNPFETQENGSTKLFQLSSTTIVHGAPSNASVSNGMERISTYSNCSQMQHTQNVNKNRLNRTHHPLFTSYLT